MYDYGQSFTSFHWCVLFQHRVELQHALFPQPRIDTNNIQVRVLYRNPIKCKVPAVRVSLGEGLHKSLAGIPPSWWYLLVPLGASVDCSVDRKWLPPMPHVRDTEVFWQITLPGCTTGSRLKQFRRVGCNSLAEIVFAAPEFCWVMTLGKSGLTVATKAEGWLTC